jgi:hypothetical protein
MEGQLYDGNDQDIDSPQVGLISNRIDSIRTDSYELSEGFEDRIRYYKFNNFSYRNNHVNKYIFHVCIKYAYQRY